jgi:hypothetical protein
MSGGTRKRKRKRGIVRGGLVERFKKEGKTGSLLLFKMKITMTGASNKTTATATTPIKHFHTQNLN